MSGHWKPKQIRQTVEVLFAQNNGFKYSRKLKLTFVLHSRGLMQCAIWRKLVECEHFWRWVSVMLRDEPLFNLERIVLSNLLLIVLSLCIYRTVFEIDFHFICWHPVDFIIKCPYSVLLFVFSKLCTPF